MRPLAAEEKKKPIKSHIFSNSFNSVPKKYATLEKMTCTNATKHLVQKKIINKTN